MRIEGHYVQGLKQPSKPPALIYWGLILACIVVGVILGLEIGVPDGGLVLIGSFIAAYIIYRIFDKLSTPYVDYSIDQSNIRSALSDMTSKSYDRFLADMHRHQREAEKALDRAEISFTAGVYSPFWDAIEEAASELGHFSENSALLSSDLKDYLYLVSVYHQTPPQFPVTSDEFAELQELYAENALAKRMSEMVEVAQQDYHFASIFEQRKTQKLLVAGFESFADVLNDVGNQITGRMEYLDATMRTHNAEMTSLMGGAAAQRERHHREVMETLDKDSDK